LTFIFRKSITLFLLLGTILLAQDPVSTDLVRSVYEDNNYPQVIELVKSDLNRNPQQEAGRLEVLLKYLALAQASLGQEQAAQSTYSTLLLVRSDFQFDPGEISPKIQSLFDNTYPAVNTIPGMGLIPPTYLIQKDRRAELILKSALMPGWGQWEADQKRAYVWGSLFTVGVVGCVISTVMTSQAHDDYLGAVQPGDIESKYGDYNTWYTARNNFLMLSLASYSLNIIDISISIPR